MRHDDVLHPGGERRSDDGVDLGATEVPCCEHEVVPGDNREDLRERLIRQLHRPGRDAGRRELVLDLAPRRRLRRPRPVFTRLVLGVHRRQPDDARALARCDLDRQVVQPPDAGVERDRAESVDAGNGRTHDGRALRRRHVVRLQHEARKPELGEPMREPEVVDAPLREIGLDVDVQVVRAADELTCPGRRPNHRITGRRLSVLQLTPLPPARGAFP